MKFPFFSPSKKDDNVQKVEEDKANEKSRQELIDYVSEMRRTSRVINNDVSSSMDTAIVAGGEVGANVKVIQSKTGELYNQISDASSASNEISANVRHFNDMIERQNKVLEKTSSAMEIMSKSVNEMADVTKQKMEAAGKLQDIIGKGGNDVSTTARAIDEVTTAINEVAGIIKVINAIAAQTNLLAMNAAIEAAHAGEMGKGFAVVAAEVRKLAESTTTNSKAIASSLKNIIDQIKGAKNASENAGITFTDIQQEVEDFVGAFVEISRSTNGLISGTQQISDSIGGLEQVSAEISGGSKEIAIGTDNIDSALRKIKDFSTGLVSDMNTIEEKICDISGAQGGMVQYMVEANRNIEGLFGKMEASEDLPKENALFNYDLIVLMHRNWLVQLRAFLDDRKKNLKATSEDHLKCGLGLWIYGEGRLFKDNGNYRELEELHKNFHAEAGAIIRTKTQGNKKEAEEQYQKLMGDYRAIVSLLDKLKGGR